MAEWDTDSAVATLDVLIEEIDELINVRRFTAQHTRWLTRTLGFLEEVFGASSRYYLSVSGIPWGHTGSVLVRLGADFEAVKERKNQEAYVRQLDSAKGILQSAADDLNRLGVTGVYRGKDTGPEASAIVRVLNMVERKLRKVIRKKPELEREIQDAFENLLVAADIEYHREAESIPYSSKTYIPDFTLPRLDLAIEIKLSLVSEHEKKFIAQMNDDIVAYQTKYGNVLFIVYDVGVIRDIDRFSGHFEANSGVLVRVIKH
jgi:hypothetical protein